MEKNMHNMVFCLGIMSILESAEKAAGNVALDDIKTRVSWETSDNAQRIYFRVLSECLMPYVEAVISFARSNGQSDRVEQYMDGLIMVHELYYNVADAVMRETVVTSL